MREWCSCGAAIQARRRDVIVWRDQHRCPDREDEPRVPPSGATSDTQIAWRDSDAVIGFRL